MSIPETIKALVKQKGNTLAVETIPYGSTDKVKNLALNEVIVKIRAIGLNPTDWKHALLDFGEPGTIVGCDGAGDVVKVGSEVKHVKVGDRVAGVLYGTKYPDVGSFAEYNRYDCAHLLKLLDSMSYEEGASYPVPHFCPVQVLYGRMKLPMPSQGQVQGTILIWGGATATGWHAIQLAKISGLKVITTASPRNHSGLLAIGADACIDYRDPQAVEKIKSAAGGDIMYAMDCVAVDGSLESCLDALATGGQAWSVFVPSDEAKAKAEGEGKIVDWVLLYTSSGYETKFGPITIPAIPSDRELVLHWSVVEFPRLMEKGLIKSQRLRKMPGGLGKVEEGLKLMQEGSYGAEKLVYTVD